MFEHFPYTNMHELNLDWIIEKVKEAYSPENPPENIVLSVNGQTGNVILYADAIVKFPTVESDSWNIYRILTGNRAAGIEFAADGTAKIINGVQRNTVYTSANPPEYPVLSVNGQTGTVVLYASQNVKFPDITETSWNLYRTADGQNLGVKFEKDTALYRINGLNRVLVYDAENQPPYPVTSVNGRTGAVSVQEPFVSTTPAILQVTPDIAGTYWGLKRDTTNGEAGIYFEAVNDTVAAYLTYKPDGESEETIRLLTLDDIPSSSGVVSVNGKSGVVTIYGDDIYVSSEVGQTIEEALTDLEEANDTQDTYITQNRNNIATETARAQATEANIEKAFATIVNGDVAAVAIPAGHYAYIKNNTHGLTEGLYTATAAFPATGGTADSTAFTPVNVGGLNDLLNNLTPVQISNPVTWDTTYVDDTVSIADLYKMGNMYVLQLNIALKQTVQVLTTVGTINANHRPAMANSDYVASQLVSVDAKYTIVQLRSNGQIRVFGGEAASGITTAYAVSCVYFANN